MGQNIDRAYVSVSFILLIIGLVVDGGGVIATITVSYQSEPLLGFLVPVEMRESYLRYPERITGHAVYGKFRPIR